MAKYDWVTIKAEYKKGSISLRDLAKKRNVPYSTLSKRAWKEKWDESRNQVGIRLESKIVEKTIEKVAEKESNRNVRFLNISDMATEAIEEYLKNKRYKEHVVKYKYYDCEGKPDKEELTSVELDVPDTKALANMISSLDKIQKGQRLAEGISTALELERIRIEREKLNLLKKKLGEDEGIIEAGNKQIKLLADLINKPEKDRHVEDFEEDDT